MIATAIVLFAASFLLGSIPWGVIVSRVMFRDDVRAHGSGNIGTTNMMRTYGKKAGAIVFVLDFAKGLFSGVLAWAAFTFAQSALGVAATDEDVRTLFVGLSFLGCVWGHIFSPWLGFKGGKGIATAVGCLFAIFGPVGACLELAIFIVLVAATKLVSLGSVAAAVANPFFDLYYFWGHPAAIVLCSIAAVTIVWAHRENIKRLLNGTESKFSMKKKDA